VGPLVVLGLGPLIRPDLAVLTATFLAADVLLADTTWLRRLRSVAIALALPVAFELFRMAYFASLVPNTALAKEASEADWTRGQTYLDNLTGTYVLAVPAVLLAVWGIVWLIGAHRTGGRPLLVLVAAPFAGGLLHGAYIVRVGGDFMHGRLLLPALFAMALSVGVLPVPRRPPNWSMAVCAAGLVLWSAVCATELRAADPPPDEWDEIVDERAIWMSLAGRKHPITVDDYDSTSVVRNGHRAREHAERGDDVLVRIKGDDVPLPPGSGVVFEADTLGLASVAAGPDVRMHDRLGLANPLVARFLANREGRIGHQKASDIVWLLARLGITPAEVEAVNEHETQRAIDAGHPDEPQLLVVDPSTLEPARRALACPATTELVEATEAPFTPARALANLRASFALTGRRFSGDPAVAASCHPAR
jgi:arabinofuranosyltransferase